MWWWHFWSLPGSFLAFCRTETNGFTCCDLFFFLQCPMQPMCCTCNSMDSSQGHLGTGICLHLRNAMFEIGLRSLCRDDCVYVYTNGALTHFHVVWTIGVSLFELTFFHFIFNKFWEDHIFTAQFDFDSRLRLTSLTLALFLNIPLQWEFF